MNSVNQFICCYDIKADAFSKCLALSNIYSDVFSNAQNSKLILLGICFKVFALVKITSYIHTDS